MKSHKKSKKLDEKLPNFSSNVRKSRVGGGWTVVCEPQSKGSCFISVYFLNLDYIIYNRWEES